MKITVVKKPEPLKTQVKLGDIVSCNWEDGETKTFIVIKVDGAYALVELNEGWQYMTIRFEFDTLEELNSSLYDFKVLESELIIKR